MQILLSFLAIIYIQVTFSTISFRVRIHNDFVPCATHQRSVCLSHCLRPLHYASAQRCYHLRSFPFLYVWCPVRAISMSPSYILPLSLSPFHFPPFTFHLFTFHLFTFHLFIFSLFIFSSFHFSSFTSLSSGILFVVLSLTNFSVLVGD